MENKVNLSKYGYHILEMETQGGCNLACSFCPHPLRLDKNAILPEKKVIEVLDSIDPNAPGFRHVGFNQINEPLLDHRIYDFIKYARRIGLPVLLATNCVMFYKSKRVINRLVESQPEFIKLSIQNLSEKDFLKVEKFKGSFKDFKRGVFDFLIAINNTPSRVVIDTGCNFITLFKDLKTRVLGLDRGDPSVPDQLSEVQENMKVFLTELKQYTGFDIDMDQIFMRKDRLYEAQKGIRITDNISLKVKPFIYGNAMTDFYPVKEIACGTSILGVLANGSVVPCCRAYDDSLALGNVKTEKLHRILENNISTFNNIRLGKNTHAVCQKCMGTPTRRGTVFKRISHFFWKSRNKNNLFQIKT